METIIERTPVTKETLLNDMRVLPEQATKAMERIAEGGDTYELLKDLSDILGCFGVESIYHPFDDPYATNSEYIASYLNVGEAYQATVVHNYETGELEISSWGDVAEGAERDASQMILDQGYKVFDAGDVCFATKDEDDPSCAYGPFASVSEFFLWVWQEEAF